MNVDPPTGPAAPSIDDPATEELTIEVTVRGTTCRLIWGERGLSGDRDAVARLIRTAGAPDDAVEFLQAARLAFGLDLHASVAGTGGGR